MCLKSQVSVAKIISRVLLMPFICKMKKEILQIAGVALIASFIFIGVINIILTGLTD